MYMVTLSLGVLHSGMGSTCHEHGGTVGTHGIGKVCECKGTDRVILKGRVRAIATDATAPPHTASPQPTPPPRPPPAPQTSTTPPPTHPSTHLTHPTPPHLTPWESMGTHVNDICTHVSGLGTHIDDMGTLAGYGVALRIGILPQVSSHTHLYERDTYHIRDTRYYTTTIHTTTATTITTTTTTIHGVIIHYDIL